MKLTPLQLIYWRKMENLRSSISGALRNGEKLGCQIQAWELASKIFLKKIRKQFPNDVFAALDGDQSRAVGLICASGGRSAYAVGLLQEAGFVNVYDISEGMRGNGQAPGWMARNLPIVPCEGC